MSNPHILLIDDDAMNLEVLQEHLLDLGASYTSVTDATKLESVLDSLKSSVDVVLLDLEMPDVNGYEVFEYLHDRLGSQVPIVACTVHTNEMKTAKELGFHSFLPKPILFENFANQLSRILNNEPVWEM